jgi:hypothetical protein
MEATTCEVCGNTKLVPALNLGLHPLCDDLVPIGDARVCKQHPIELLLCPTCVTVHQRFQVPKADLFPPSYHYRARFTADVLAGMRQLVAACAETVGDLTGKLVVDIGCNDGSLLGFFRDQGCKTVGVEPTDAAKDAVEQGHPVYNDFISPEVAARLVKAHGTPDIITFTNVFAHIENLPELFQALRLMLGPQTMLVVENHYLGAVLDRFQFDTFYHEHPRTYSATSFLHVARALGLRLLDVQFPSRYGGNIRVLMGSGQGGSAAGPRLDEVMAKEQGFAPRLLAFQAGIAAWRQRTRAELAALVSRHGSLPAKAFPARAAILIRLLELDANDIGATYERPGSKKVGHYVPGTRIPIRSEEELFAASPQPRVVLNLAWHIRDEIHTYLAQHGVTGEIVDIFRPESFVAA